MIRVLLVDDQELVRSGFRIILESEPDIEIVGEAANGIEAVALAADTAPDVVCMDVEMPEMNGIEAARRILAASADGAAPAILILTTFGHDEYLFDALAAGVSGFLLKASRAEQLIDAVRTLERGEALLGPAVTRAVMTRAAASEAPSTSAATGTATGVAERVEAHAQTAGLTEREREVLALVAEGRSNGEIAQALFLGEATVKTHVSNLLQKMGARDRIQLIVWAHTGEGS
ncbi:response regulator [Leucobacter sp. GX0328]